MFRLLAGMVAMVMAGGVMADPLVPQSRYVASSDMDFYGADLQPIFDTDLDACVRACTAQTACAAFTFNTRSNACFPKSEISARESYVGALSAEKIPTPAAVLAQAQDRAPHLGFLGDATLAQAHDMARDLGLRHPAGRDSLDSLLTAARARLEAGNLREALRWMGGAVSLSDRAPYWADYAEILLRTAPQRHDQRREDRSRAVLAATNSYLRSTRAGEQTRALMLLAQGLQQTDRGRQSIDALRLAHSLQPRDDIAQALEKAIGQFGFRVVDSTVDSDVAAPRICAQFSEDLVQAGVDYDTFVRLPAGDLAVQPQGNQLCIDGVDHGQRYRLTLRRGLPAASGETLHRDVELTHYVRDRAPLVRFPGRAYVLPRTADAALPVVTVNATELELTLRRISDRNLVRALQNGLIGRPMSAWEDEAFETDLATQIWSGTAQVQNTLNREMTTRLPMDAALAGQPPGIYALRARLPGVDPYDDPGSTQWFVLSDLGLSTLSGQGGLQVSVQGLGDAQPRAGIQISLISRANAVLGTVRSDANGRAQFDPGLIRGTGSAAPALIVARDGDRDLAFLSLTDPAFDLSDRGVEGRAPAAPIDVFLTTDRGAYRAGETIHATALARTPEVAAIEGLPLIAVLSRPDGVEYRRLISGGGHAGGHVFALPVAPSAPRGSWSLAIYADPKAPALARQTVLVEDFLPERIDFDQSLPNAALRPGDSPPLTINARYLFGAPGADLGIDGQVRLQPVRDLADWPGYVFGRHDAETRVVSSYFGGSRTDASGQARIAIDIPRPDVTDQPLQATVITRLADGAARPVERQLTVAVQPDSPVIGIKPQFDDVVPEGSAAGFDLIALAPDLTPAALPLRWTLNRVETTYQWYQLYGDWKWEPITRRSRIATGDVTAQGTPIPVSAPVDWGSYELVVETLQGPYAVSSAQFHAGWFAPAGAADTPDRLQMSLDASRYAPGDTAQLRLVPRAAGTAMIAVMSDHVVHRQTVEVPEGETVIPLPVTADWGAGAYVTATVIRPMDVAAGQNPTRAIGLAYAGVEPLGKRLDVTIEAPDLARPRGPQPVTVTVEGAGTDPVWLTLAAVDQGILNLTGFQPPDPQEYYFGQRRLGVEMRDLYGRLIDGMNGAMGTVRSGGDAGAQARLQAPPPTQDLMAQFSGPIAVDADGRATVVLDLPPFNGAVRLMAVAWSPQAVGQADAEMTVRDPVVVTATLPRFLAPGDQARMHVQAVHADGPSGDMQMQITAPGLTLGTYDAAFVLGDQGSVSQSIALTAGAVGDVPITLTLTTPDGTKLTQTLTLGIRANDPEQAQTRRFALGAGDTLTLGADLFADLQPGTGTALLSTGPLARMDVPGLLTQLDRYPYGCTEQVASQTLPLLYLSGVAQQLDLATNTQINDQIQAGIRRVLARQAPNGAFGLWQADSGQPWLDAYVTDLLSRARAAGHAVPQRAFDQALDNLRNQVSFAADFDQGGEALAYALMVLAREGAAAMGDLRYYADVKGAAFATPLAAAQLGAALAMYGDQPRADAMFARAADLLQRPAPRGWRGDFGTRLRDAAAVVALGAEADSAVIQPALLRTGDQLSTQEAAWTLLAAHALTDAPETSGLMLDGVPAPGPFLKVSAGDPARHITTRDGAEAQITLTTLGIPQIPPPAGGTGYAITRSYYDMQGAPFALDQSKTGDRFVTVLTVTPFDDTGARLMLNDPLPAGIEIDNPNLMRSGDVAALDWLDLSEVTHAEFRAERFLAAVDTRDATPVTVAYVARAVTPGVFHHPAASVEDMYRPTQRAWTDAGRVTIAP